MMGIREDIFFFLVVVVGVCYVACFHFDSREEMCIGDGGSQVDLGIFFR